MVSTYFSTFFINVSTFFNSYKTILLKNYFFKQMDLFYLLILYCFKHVILQNLLVKKINFYLIYFYFYLMSFFFFSLFNYLFTNISYDLKFYNKLYLNFFFEIQKKNLNKLFFEYSEINIYLKTKYFYNIIFFLKKELLFYIENLSEIIAFDKLKYKDRFEIIYYFLSLRNNVKVFLRIKAQEFEAIPTLSNFFKSATWLEREVWDLFGIYFLKNKDLRRILTDYGFEGHPLRRDFPLTGFFELYYNHSYKKIIYEPVSLAQKYRNFRFENKWLNN